MGARRRFGAFGGVFTPSILTILGVIMYLRLPWVVGQAGMWAAIGIVVAAHIVSVTTGLSVSSIATDKRVKAGGSYFIISRSLGLPLGGTVGLALFVGLSFGVSLYLVGFSESFLSYWDIGIDPATGLPDANTIRVAGSIALLTVTVITFISTSLAIKTQYLIMAAIACSLLSILIGRPDAPAPALPHLDGLAAAPPLIVLFGVFFPAVTGFEAGVSMSGDLKDPKGDIPRGTLSAIAVGFLVYIGLCVFLAYRIPAEQLASNPNVLLDYSWFAPVVVAGVWGATISSALGSILGAPRILQACAADRIGPRWFARGAGPDNEPRNALLLTFLIAEGGILIGSLDAIAAVVSMFFMASYGVLNLSCAVESWASPDFRPGFRIPRAVSVVGALACFVLMMQLDVLAMAGAFLVMGALYALLKRKELALEGGDTWSGIWSAVARKALDRLARAKVHDRNWRPNLLVFARDAASPVFELGRALTAHNGVSTEVALVAPGDGPDDAAGRERPEGTFYRRLPTATPLAAVSAMATHHGLGGLEPNTVLLDAELLRAAVSPPAAFTEELRAVGRHLVVARLGRGLRQQADDRIDLWWRGDGANLAFLVALARFLTAAGDWVQASVALRVLVADPSERPRVEQRLVAWLQDTRVLASVHVVDAPGADGFGAVVARASAGAALVIVGLTDEEAAAPPVEVARLLSDVASPLLLVRAASTFADPLPGLGVARPPRAEVASALPGATSAWAPPPALDGAPPMVSRYHAALAEALDRFLAHGHGSSVALLTAAFEDVERIASRTLDQLERAARLPEGPRRDRALRRCRGGVLRGVRAAVGEVERRYATELEPALRAAVGALADCLADIEAQVDETVALPGAEPGRGGISARWRAALGAVTRRPDPARWPLRRQVAERHSRGGADLVRSSFQRQRVVREQLLHALVGAVTWLMETSRAEARRLAAAGPEPASQHEDLTADLAALVAAWTDLVGAATAQERAALSAFAADAAVGVAEVVVAGRAPAPPRGSARPPGQSALDVAALVEESGSSWSLQHHHLARAALDVALHTLHHDLESLAVEVERDAGRRVRAGVLGPLDSVIEALREAGASVVEEPAAALPVGTLAAPHFDDAAVLGRMTERVDRDLEALPEEVETLTAASFQALSEGRVDDLQEVTVAVRRLVSFVVRSDLLGALREHLGEVEAGTRRAAASVRDVARLLSFQEAEGAGDLERADLAEERLALIDGAIDRLGAEREALAATWERARLRLHELTAAAVERTRAGEIGRSAGELERFIRRESRAGLVSGLGGIALRARDQAQRGLIDLSYRWSSSMAAARRLQDPEEAPPPGLERLLAARHGAAPDPGTLDALPVFYRQVFLGRAADDPVYWRPPEALLGTLRTAVAAHAAGRSGAVWVTGPVGAGRGGLLRRVTDEVIGARTTFSVTPPDLGTSSTEHFDDALLAALRFGGAVEDALATLPHGAVLRVEGLELWWERRPGGLAVLERLAGLVDRHGSRVLFVLGANEHTVDLLRRLGVLADRSLGTLCCPRLDALALRDTILQRHASTGLGLRLEGARRDREPSGWQLARLFSDLSERAEGDVAAALTGWIAHVVEVRPGAVVVRRPQAFDMGAFDSVTPEQAAVLAALVLHRRVDLPRLARVMGAAADDQSLLQVVADLRRGGLVSGPAEGPLELDRFLSGYAIRWLRTREVL